jgi:protein disulfide-isomerase A1
MLPLENMVAADLDKFVDDLVSGALTPYLKSQTVQPAEGAMAVIVGSNFDEIVLDTSKNVFIAYYAP